MIYLYMADYVINRKRQMRFTKKTFAIVLLCGILMFGAARTLFGQEASNSGVKLSPIFSDNMVLQRDISAPIWGTATPGENVSVRFKEQEKSAVADIAGKWIVHLDPLTASAKPEKLTVTGRTGQLVFNNVLIGEVWLCSGQSNMESSFGYLKISDEIKGVDYPQIRLTGGEKWNQCTTDNLMGFSCVGYYFGMNLWKQLHVPIGLINISRGCSSIEAWMTPDSMAANDSLIDANGCNLLAEMKKFQQFVSNYDRCSPAEKERMFLEHCQSKYSFARQFLDENGKPKIDKYNDILGHMRTVKPAYQFNTRIAPIVPFGIRGTIWYQGETNVGDSQYAQKQQLLIESWRKLWKESGFPFYIVQVAPFKWYAKLPEFWLEQYEAVRKTPQTGLISTVDISDINECHPLNKRDVGLRLALLALRDTYGKKDTIASGPAYKSTKVDGAKIVVEFDHTGTGLTTKDGKSPNWFEVAGADGKFVKAEAAIQGNTVAINSPLGSPVYVRYAWNCCTDPNLCNKEGLPAFPFNTAESFFQQHKK